MEGAWRTRSDEIGIFENVKQPGHIFYQVMPAIVNGAIFAQTNPTN